MSPDERQAVLDDEHLRLLALFHYISGGMTLAFSLLFGVWFTFMGAVLALVSEAHGVLEVLSGRYISQRRRWLFSFIVSLPHVYGKAQ
jgi:TRAP-type C4-dicarboxylate transport system permease small subunit